MRITLLFSFAFIFQVISFGQTDTTKVPFAAYWEKGDTFRFKITKTIQIWQGKKLTQNDSSQYFARFEVMDADTASYTIRWSFKNTLFDAFKIPEVSRKKFSKVDMVEVIYKTDEFGAFIGIENWQEISKMMNNLIRDFVNLMEKDTSVNKAELKKTMEPIISLYGSKRGIEQIIFKDLQIIHYPFGREYARDKIYNYAEKLPNLLGGNPVTGIGIIYFKSVDFKNHRGLLVQRMKILPDTAYNMLHHYLKGIGVLDAALEQTINESKIDIIDDNTFDYYWYPGIPVIISAKRESVLYVLEDRVRRIDKTIIERVE